MKAEFSAIETININAIRLPENVVRKEKLSENKS